MAKFVQARRRLVRSKKRLREPKTKRTSNSTPQRAPHQIPTKLSWPMNFHPLGYFKFSNLKNAVNLLMTTFISLYWSSQSSIKKRLVAVINTVFPWRTCQPELRALQQRLQKLEREFSNLQTALQNKGTHSTSAENPCYCKWICPGEGNKVSSAIPAHQQAAAPLPVAFVTSLPPPPPPPPPLPASAFFNQKRLPVLKKVESTRVLKEAPAQQDGPIQITLKDLLNVKLRKARDNVEKQKMGLHQNEPISSISLSGIQGKTLKLASKMPPRNLASILMGTPNISPLHLRKHLKKVNMVRSPGGTPIYNRNNKENGTGLTPIMTKALRQRFQLAHPKSPSPRRVSPGNRSFEEVH